MSRFYKYAWVLFIFLAFALRISNMGQVFHERGVTLCDPDGCYHMLLVGRIMDHYPKVPTWDSGLAHPTGAKIPWPPLFDFLIATLALPFRLIWSNAAADKVAALVPPLLGSLAIIPLAFFVRRWKKPLITFTTLLIYSLMPAAVAPAMLCVLDHHVAVLLMNLILALTFLRTIEKGERLGLAISAAVLMHVWAASAIHLVPIGLTCLWLYFSRSQAEYVSRAGQALVLSAVFYVLGLLFYWPPEWWQASFVYPSLFQAYELLLVGAAIAMLRSKRTYWQELALAAAVAILGIVLLPGLRSALAQGASFFAKDNPWLNTIAEYHPLIGSGIYPVWQEISKLLISCGFTFMLLPLVIPLWLIRHRAPHDKLAAVIICVLLTYSLNQSRYLWSMAPWLALSAAWAVELVINRIHGAKRWAVAGLLIALIMFPCAIRVYAYPRIKGDADMRAMIEAARFLGEYDEQQRGKGLVTGVMSPWYWGHVLHYYSGLPVVVDGFGNTLARNGLYDSAMFYSTSSDEQALAILAEHEVRYVVATQPIWEVLNDLKILGQEISTLFVQVNHPRAGLQVNPSPAFYDTLAARMYFRHSSGKGIRPPENFELIYTTQGQGMGNVAQSPQVLIYKFTAQMRD